MAAERRAHTTWEGDLASGSGTFTVGTGAIGPQQVSWPARTEEPGGKTSPEELIAAALSSCFSMALSGSLAKAGTPPTSLETDAVATFDKTDAGFRMTKIDVRVRGTVEGVDEEAFRRAAEDAKENCPVSQALKGNVELTLDAALAQS
jgi:osmotically inducible protein OsmC